mmetsp:Transcript_4409/g.12993  ORF Transcript_4409/g.12993 Transcript_4409/m.12993 type:complete len:214 (-) Transcript_4409:66-707(-)
MVRRFCWRAQDMDPKTIATVKSTARVMKEHGYEITQEMYATMFEEHEDIKALFNHDNMVVHPGETKKKQPLLLAQAVHAYAENIDNLSLLESAVDRITKKVGSSQQRPGVPALTRTPLLSLSLSTLFAARERERETGALRHRWPASAERGQEGSRGEGETGDLRRVGKGLQLPRRALHRDGEQPEERGGRQEGSEQPWLPLYLGLSTPTMGPP